MQLKKTTIEKLGDTLIHLGEASIIGGVATLFVEEFVRLASWSGVIGGLLLITLGLFLNDNSDKYGVR